jgi:hypothetical protein
MEESRHRTVNRTCAADQSRARAAGNAIRERTLSDVEVAGVSVDFVVIFSRARWDFASAHGRPNGVPGRTSGAREKSSRQSSWLKVVEQTQELAPRFEFVAA